MDYDFHLIHVVRKMGSPMVHLEVTFVRTSRIGDMLEFRLTVAELGSSSARLRSQAFCGNEQRFMVTPTLVHSNQAPAVPKAVTWPDNVRAAMEPFDEEGALGGDTRRGWDRE